jgi:hypothetical protein
VPTYGLAGSSGSIATGTGYELATDTTLSFDLDGATDASLTTSIRASATGNGASRFHDIATYAPALTASTSASA